jgi:hypothetical protein
MKRRRFLRTHRLSILAALTVALAAVGLTAFAASAGADFNIEAGKLLLTSGTKTGTPPSGSWVLLSNKTTGALFLNTTSTAENEGYTLINGGGGSGLTFGSAQPTGGIFGTLTLFDGAVFSALTLPGSKPLLTFSGTDSQTTPRLLLGGNLLGLDIEYGGQLYNVGTQYNSFPDALFPLRGLIVGNTLATKAPFATILLHWSTGILLAPFNEYNALFNWVGTYDLP